MGEVMQSAGGEDFVGGRREESVALFDAEMKRQRLPLPRACDELDGEGYGRQPLLLPLRRLSRPLR